MDTKSKEKMYNAKVTEILAGAYKYGTDNIDNLTNECLDVTVGTLLKLGYVKSDDNSGFYVTNPKIMSQWITWLYVLNMKMGSSN